jgi:hypothetical protein
MIKLAEEQPDLTLESLCLSLAQLLSDPAFQTIDGDLFGEIVMLGASLWRHTDEFRKAGDGSKLHWPCEVLETSPSA